MVRRVAEADQGEVGQRGWMAPRAPAPAVPAAGNAPLDDGAEIRKTERAGPQNGDLSVAELPTHPHHLLVREPKPGAVQLSSSPKTI